MDLCMYVNKVSASNIFRWIEPEQIIGCDYEGSGFLEALNLLHIWVILNVNSKKMRTFTL